MGKTLFDKVWDSHVIERIEDGPDVLFIDKHFIHEVTSPVAFVGLKNRNLKAAGVDVYEDYSSSIKNKLKKLSNFIFTPHIAGISDNSEERNKKLLFNNIRNFIKKKRNK